MLLQQTVRDAVRAAIEEDLGPGDVTSQAVVERDTRARGRIVARQPLVVAGLPVAREVFHAIDPDLAFLEECPEGADAAAGQALLIVEGSARSILAAERTALNFLQRMCGIATTCRRLVRLAGENGAQIADTRKTAPGLRALDKYAVRIGGGTNHRAGLFDAVLIKDNHWRLAGGVGEAIRRARREAPPSTVAAGTPGAPGIEVEVGTLAEVEEALAAGADALLLDNMDGDTLEKAVTLARGRAFLEVSGGVREEDVSRLSAAGIDRISIGALTHSVRAADIALELERA